MPDWVKDVVKNAFPRRMEDFSDLQKQLQDLLNKYKVKVQGRRVESGGQPSAEDAGQHAASARGDLPFIFLLSAPSEKVWCFIQ